MNLATEHSRVKIYICEWKFSIYLLAATTANVHRSDASASRCKVSVVDLGIPSINATPRVVAVETWSRHDAGMARLRVMWNSAPTIGISHRGNWSRHVLHAAIIGAAVVDGCPEKFLRQVRTPHSPLPVEQSSKSNSFQSSVSRRDNKELSQLLLAPAL